MFRCPYSFFPHSHHHHRIEHLETIHLQLFQDNTLSVGSTTKGGNLVSSTKGTLLVGLVSPALVAASSAQLTGSVESSRLVLAYEKAKGIRIGS